MSVEGRCQRRELDPEGSQCRNAFSSTCVRVPSNQTSISWYDVVWEANGFCRFMAKENGKSTWLQDEMSVVFTNVYGPNAFWPSNDAPLTQRHLYFTCLDSPFACRNSLLNICSRYTAKTLQGYNLFCSCYLPYSEYSRDESLFNIKRECSSICHNSQAVPYSNFFGETLRCDDSLCIINDININLLDSTSGDIAFSQLCGTCGDGGLCRCKISDISINAIEATLGDISFDQNCQGNIECYAQNPDDPSGPSILVDCATQEALDTEIKTSNEGSIRTFIRNEGVLFYGTISFIVAILIIFVLLFIRKRRDQNEEDKIIDDL